MANNELDICRWWWISYFPGDKNTFRADSPDIASRLEEIGGVLDWFQTDTPQGGAQFVKQVRNSLGIERGIVITIMHKVPESYISSVVLMNLFIFFPRVYSLLLFIHPQHYYSYRYNGYHNASSYSIIRILLNISSIPVSNIYCKY